VADLWKGIRYDGFMANPPQDLIPFDTPAVYQIAVQGRVDPAWSDRLEGMAIRQAAEGPYPPVTSLEGELIDQAALVGVLNTLYELHLSVVSVERLSPRANENRSYDLQGRKEEAPR
jgi:hypothetical protein